MDVREAARELGVSLHRVRQLIAQGDLKAQRVGRFWVLDEASVRRRAEVDVRHGRPYASRQVWRMAAMANALLHEEAGGDLGADIRESLSPQARWQLRHYLAGLAEEGEPKNLAWRLRGRADEIVKRYCHPAALAKVARDPRVVLSGSHGAAERGADLVPDDFLDGYLDPVALDEVIHDYGLVEVDDGVNICLRSAAEIRKWRGGLHPAHGDQDVAPLLLVVADLSEREEARASLAAKDLWSQLRHRLRSRAS